MTYREKMKDGTTRITGQAASDVSPVIVDGEDKFFNFAVATNPWTLYHGLNDPNPLVTLRDPSGKEFEGDITHVDNNTIRVDFAFPVTGSAYVSN